MNIRRWSIAIVVCVSITALLAGFKVMQIRQAMAFAASFPEQSEAVSVVSVEQKLWTPKVTAMGEVLALSAVDLRNELGGKIIEVGFKPGARVTKGQLLLRLDTTEELAQLSAAQAELKLAKLDLDRYKRLIKSNSSSKDQYDRALAELSVAAAKTQVLQAIIDKKTLLAPFDAEAGLHELEPGQYLADDSLITRLVGIHPDVWIDFNLPQQESMLAIGTELSAEAPGLLNQAVTGVVIARNPLVNSQSRNIRIRALFPQVSEHLKPGVIVEVSVPLSQPQTVAFLPGSAIRYDNYGSFVYVLLKDSEDKVRAHKRKISVLQEQQQQVIVAQGLNPGERIAATGSYKLRDGMLVSLVETQPTTSTEGASIHE